MCHHGCVWLLVLFLTVNDAADCPPPQDMNITFLTDESNGRSEYPSGSTVDYVCASGYMNVSGLPVVTCLNGVWSNLTLQCKKKSCGSPKEIPNGWYNLSQGIEFGAMIKFTCDEGYEIRGSTYFRCLSSGWSGIMPRCIEVTCGKPPEVSHGKIVTSIEVPRYMDVIQYVCEENRLMIGSGNITCNKKGMYEPSPPECKAGCAHPQATENTLLTEETLLKTDFPHGSIATHQCPPDYVNASGSAVITCSDGVWSSLSLICTERSCGPPGKILHGRFNLSQGLQLGAKITVICDEGYHLVRQSDLECLSTGWSGVMPVCKEHTCPVPSVENGFLLEGGPEPYRYQHHVTFQCNTGYVISGESKLVCGLDSWNAAFPTCTTVPEISKRYYIKEVLIGTAVLAVVVVIGCSVYYYYHRKKGAYDTGEKAQKTLVLL